MRSTRRNRFLALPLAAAVVAALPAQGLQGLQRNAAEAKAVVLAEAWFGRGMDQEPELRAAVAALLAVPDFGIRWVGAELPQALAARQVPRSKGVIALATHVTLDFIEQQARCGIVFAGQYAPLQALQPFASDLLFQLLLDTPSWFPDTHRIRLVAALRDLQPQAPDDGRVAAVVALAENVAIEPEPLREALACMLWQWGRREFAQPLLTKLQQESADGDVDDRVRALLQLAGLQYQLRDHRAAANTHRALQKLAEATHYPLKPNDVYAGACVFALGGDVEHGIAALQRCADLQVAPGTDSSLRLARNLVEKDPEIALLRRDPRFAAIFARMFPADRPPEPTAR